MRLGPGRPSLLQLEVGELGLGEASAEIDDIIESAAFERAGGEIAALAFLAEDENLSIVGKLSEAIAQLTERNIHRIGQAAKAGEFISIADVEQ